MKKIIVINGPPRSGKDTICQHLLEKTECSEEIKFTKPVKEITHANAGLCVLHDYFETVKDTPNEIFSGKTPREAYIETSENLREKHGQTHIAELFAEEIRKSNAEIILNSDIGFDFELNLLIEEFGNDSILLIKLERDGKSFQNDCRNYLSDTTVDTVLVKNAILNDFLDEGFGVVEQFLIKKNEFSPPQL